MRRRIEKPRILLLDCNLEYKKGESQTEIEISKETDFGRLLQLEEEYIERICADIIRVQPDLIITEKGISDLAQHYLSKAGISAIRRLRKTDNNRISRATGATIVHRTEELKEDDLGTGCGLFEIKKIGDDYFSFFTGCENPKACTILLRGASKDVLNEVERNLQDALCVARNVISDPRLVPGGGASEMTVSALLKENAKNMTDIGQWPYLAVAQALEIIPATLIQNCGGNALRNLTALRAAHAVGHDGGLVDPNMYMGVNGGGSGESDIIIDVRRIGLWEPLAVKAQTYKTAIETAVLLLRIDDIVSGTKKQDSASLEGPSAARKIAEGGDGSAAQAAIEDQD